MTSTHVVLDPAFAVGELDRRIFGTFVEHMGRCVYTGIYEPSHPHADDLGFRSDVANLTRELGATIVRYPGGNFVSGYRWEDGVGPVAQRPARLDLAWRSIETNEVGLDEFVGWARRTGVEPLMVVNLGTRGLQAACNLLEYSNTGGGTVWSDLRGHHGHREPYGIRTWGLGNEMDGPWQIGHKTAHEYGRLAVETARAMRRVDPTIELVACGSSGRGMPTFGRWEAEVLEHCYEAVDHISLHAYYEERSGDLASFLASSVDMERFITSVVATVDHVGAIVRSRHTVNLAFDEWNVWYQDRVEGPPRRDRDPHPALGEYTFSLADAVAVGGLLNALVRHADRVRIACQAQLVNVLGMIRTQPGGPAWRQSIFHPFAQTARLARGTVLRVEARGESHETVEHGEVTTVDVAATFDQENSSAAVFLVNRHPTQARDVCIDVRAMPGACVRECLQLADTDPRVANTLETPERVAPRRLPSPQVTSGRVLLRLPAVSWTALDLSTAGGDARRDALGGVPQLGPVRPVRS